MHYKKAVNLSFTNSRFVIGYRLDIAVDALLGMNDALNNDKIDDPSNFL